MNSTAAIIPLKMNSRRLPNKNFLSLGGIPLCAHVFNSLSKVSGIDIYCYCANPRVMDLLPSSIRYLPRDPYYNGDNILGSELFASAIKKLPDYEHILITHATSPFVRAESFQAAFEAKQANQPPPFLVDGFQRFRVGSVCGLQICRRDSELSSCGHSETISFRRIST